MSNNKPILLVIDGNSVAHRAFHAIRGLSRSDGFPTGAVYGFTKILMGALSRFSPEYVAVAFDLPEPTFRHKKYLEYKAGRRETDPDLIRQFAVIKEAVLAFSIPVVELAGFEADDVLGTLSLRAKDQGLQTIILTSDMDALQLVDLDTSVFTAKKGMSEEVIYTPLEVVKKYGFGPEHVVDFKSIAGDSSDNIPGVKGIGKKGATDLICSFGSLDDIFEHALTDENVKPRTKKLLQEGRESAYLSHYLATIIRDVPVESPFTELHFSYSEDRVKSFLQTYELRSLLKNLSTVSTKQRVTKEKVVKKSLPNSPANMNDFFSIIDTPSPQIESEYLTHSVSSPDELNKLRETLLSHDVIAFDTETTAESPHNSSMVGISFATHSKEGYYIPIGHTSGGNAKREDVLSMLHDVFSTDKVFVGHNLKYDFHILRNTGVPVPRNYFDTMVAAYLQLPGQRRYGLKNLAFTHLGMEMTEYKDLFNKSKPGSFADISVIDGYQYAAMDAISTFGLYEYFYEKLKKSPSIKAVFDQIEMPLLRVLFDMESKGILLDDEMLRVKGEELKNKIADIQKKVFDLAGEDFLLSSPKQLSTILFEKLGIKKTKRRKTGYATDASSLEKIRDEHALIPLILEYREYAKLLSTYVEGLLPLQDPKTKRIYTTFSQITTSTGRLSSSNPNLQNIPVRSQNGRDIRSAFRAREGMELLMVDYSQMEFRMLAHMADEPRMIEAFLAGEDLHKKTAMQIFGVASDGVTSEMRRAAKTVNFGVLYGQTKYGLQRELGVSTVEAEEFIKGFFTYFKRAKEFFESVTHDALLNGYVETITGRRRYIAELSSTNRMVKEAGIRMAMNMPIQGSAAEIMKMAMIEIGHKLSKENYESQMLLQVHDEVVLEVPIREKDTMQALVQKSMKEVYELKVPLISDAHFSTRWEK